METNKNRDRIIKKIEELPTLPIVSHKIMEVTKQEGVSFQEIAKIVEKDQALALKILKIANSTFYGFLSRISSLEHALALLGTHEVKSIVLGSSIHNFFSDNRSDGFDRQKFWEHAILCSQTSKFLGTYFNIREDDSIFLSGLIHDMGKVVIDQYFHEEFLQIIEYVSTKNTTFSNAEKAILGTTHYQIAAKLLKQWKFPAKVIMQVFYHHAPWYDKNYEANSIILYLANIFTKLAGYPCHQGEKRIDIDEFANSAEVDFVIKSGFYLDHKTIKNLINHIRESASEEADNMMSFFG